MKNKKINLIAGAFAVVVLATPTVVGAATNSANSTLNATIGDVISLTSSGTVTISLAPTSAGVVSSASDTITVNTNRTAGYNLKLSDVDTVNNLVSGANTITPMGTTWGSPAVLTNGKWGYGIASGTAGLTAASGFSAAYSAETNNASSTTVWLGVPSSAAPQTLKTTAAVATNDQTTIWYGVRASTAQPGGTYTDAVVYTATTN